MAAHIGQPSRSRRFIKVYLITWGILAVGAVAYLGFLAYPHQAATSSRSQTAKVAPVKVSPVRVSPVKVVSPVKTDAAKVEPAKVERPQPDQAKIELAKPAPPTAKDLAEVRGTLTEVRKDVTQLQDAMGERVTHEKATQSRLTALEERVATIDPPQTPPATPGHQPADKSAHQPPDVTTADILAKTKEEPAAAPPVEPRTPPPASSRPIETGSIAPEIASKGEIVFGEVIVTPAVRKDFAVQLAAGPSQKALRTSWGRLVERHRGALASLKPRIVAPLSEGGIYRLLAGPVPTKADADRICAALGGAKACFVTAYAGAPL
jgi:hypothetical protein